MRMRTVDMLHGTIWKTILIFFFPIFFGSVFQQLYNTVDAVVVGNFVGKQALGAVGGSTGTLINLLVGFVVGLTSGATVVIAQAYGSHDEKQVRDGVNAGMLTAFVLGAALSLLGIVFADEMLKWMNVPADIYEYSLIYMRIYMFGMIPNLLYNACASILRAVGDSRRPLYFLISACLVNIVLDIVFVVGFHWGTAGAAWATVIAQIVSCIMGLRVLAGTSESYSFHIRQFSVNSSTLKSVITIGLPLGIQSSMYSVSNLFVQAAVNGFGTNAVAAWTAYGKIDAMFWNVSNALGSSVLTFIGQNYGAGKAERVKKGIWQSLILYIILAILLSVICLTSGPVLCRLFTSDQDVIHTGMSILRLLAPFWCTFAFIEVLSQTMRACGQSFLPMMITALGIAGFRIAWIVLNPVKTLFDALICYPVSWMMTSLIFVISYWLWIRWRKRK